MSQRDGPAESVPSDTHQFEVTTSMAGFPAATAGGDGKAATPWTCQVSSAQGAPACDRQPRPRHGRQLTHRPYGLHKFCGVLPILPWREDAGWVAERLARRLDTCRMSHASYAANRHRHATAPRRSSDSSIRASLRVRHRSGSPWPSRGRFPGSDTPTPSSTGPPERCLEWSRT